MQTMTPWGPAQQTQEIAGGVLWVDTAGHGGLILSPERWEQLPGEVRGCLLNRGFAEEDCEANIALTLLGLATPGQRDAALRTARRLRRYAPALPRLADASPEGCWTCGQDESAADSATLAPGRWLCRKCFEKRSGEDFMRLVEQAMRAARDDPREHPREDPRQPSGRNSDQA